MTIICLECATPKSTPSKIRASGAMASCLVCRKDTHTIDGEARRPQCHDCKFFCIQAVDGQYYPWRNYGAKASPSRASCRHSEDNVVIDALGRKIVPYLTKFDQGCEVFEKHHLAPNDGRPNPLTLQERNEWRDYLKTPMAFWLDPKRWEGIDPTKKKFWDKKTVQKNNGTKLLFGGLAIAGALLAKTMKTTKEEQ